MSPSLHRLVYQSAATVPLSETELSAILRQSREWNTAHALTGVLLYSHGDIMQVLEGPEKEVRHIFGRISRDSRHGHVTKLSDGPIRHRHFPQWSMGFKIVEPANLAQLKGYLNPAQTDYLTGATTQDDVDLDALLATFVTDVDVRP